MKAGGTLLACDLRTDPALARAPAPGEEVTAALAARLGPKVVGNHSLDVIAIDPGTARRVRGSGGGGSKRGVQARGGASAS